MRERESCSWGMWPANYILLPERWRGDRGVRPKNPHQGHSHTVGKSTSSLRRCFRHDLRLRSQSSIQNSHTCHQRCSREATLHLTWRGAAYGMSCCGSSVLVISSAVSLLRLVVSWWPLVLYGHDQGRLVWPGWPWLIEREKHVFGAVLVMADRYRQTLAALCGIFGKQPTYRVWELSARRAASTEPAKSSPVWF
jgi:hypothetical protein